MRALRKIPFVKLVVPYILGILLSGFVYFDGLEWLFLFLIALGVCFSFTLAKQFKLYQFDGYAGTLILFVFGVVNYNIQFSISSQNSNQLTDGTYTIKAAVGEIPNLREKSVKISLNLIDILNEDEKLTPIQGKMMAYFERSEEADKLIPGDIIVFKTKLEKLAPAEHSIGFNFNNYLLNNGYSHSIYLSKERWIKTDEFQNTIKNRLNNIRMQLIEILENNGLRENNLAIVSALLLGYRDLLSSDVKNYFASAGATHILAVSGLHVGIIFIMLNFMLSFLKSRREIYLKTFLILLFLWFYACLTGLSPSVIRASVMFSFVAVGNATKRFPNIYNTIAASAFFILLFQPNLLYSIGFQLSYLAVLGIIYIQPKIYERFKSPYWIVDKAWALLCVSVAAQLATFPLGLFYFHQFPNLFFITNLVVVPAAGWVIYSGITSLIVSSVPFLDIATVFVLDSIVSFIRWSVEIVNKIPYSSTQGIYINGNQTILLYLFVIAIGLFLANKIKIGIFLALFALNLWFLEGIIFDFKSTRNHYIVLYDTPEVNPEFIIGRKSILGLTEDTELPIFSRNDVLGEFKIEKTSYLDFPHGENFEIENSKNQILWMKKNQFTIPQNRGSIWVLNDFSKAIPDSLFQIYQPKEVVLGSHLSYKTRNSILQSSKNYAFKVSDLKKQGLILITL